MTQTVHLPNGATIDFPDGTPVEIMQQFIQSQNIRWQAQHGIEPSDPTEGMSGPSLFAAGAGKAPVDLARGVGQLVGLQSQQDIDESRAFDAPLMDTGAGLAGNVTGNLAETVGGGLALRGIPAAAGVGNALLAPRGYGAAAGAGAGLAGLQPVGSEDFGGPFARAVNTAFGAGAGATGQALPRIVGAGVRGTKALLDPLTQGGQERIAARTLARYLANPDAIGNAADSVVPGVQRTLAEASLDPGVAQLERAMQNSDPTFANMLAQQRGTNNAARLGALGGIAGDESDIAAAEAARIKAAFPDLAKAKKAVGVEAGRVVGLIDRILASPSGKRDAVASALSSVRDKLTTESGYVDDVATLYGIRQHIGDLMCGMLAGDSAAAGLAKRELMTVKSALDHQIAKVAPEFKSYLAAYQEGSVPINQMQIGQEIVRRSTGATDDFMQNPVLSPAGFGKAMKNGDQVAAAATGFKRAELEKIMSPEQMQTLGAVRDDLMRQNSAATTARAPGSPTAQNLAAQNVLRQTLGPLGVPDALIDHPVFNGLAKALNTAYKMIGSNDPAALREVLLNPQQAQRIMYYLPPADRKPIEGLIAAYGGVPLTTAFQRAGDE